MVWWLIPLVAMATAIIWTALLARRERRRADEKWRAARLAKVGHKLVETTLPTGPAEGKRRTASTVGGEDGQGGQDDAPADPSAS